MYFNAEAQDRILARFHFALNDTGFLFLGKAEMLTRTSLFTPVDLKQRIFAKVPKVNLRDRLFVLAQAGNPEIGNRENINHVMRQVRLREVAFDAQPVAQAIVDVDGSLVVANEQVRSLFGVSLKDLGRPFRDLELSYRPVGLRSVIERVYAERSPAMLTNVERHLPDGSAQHLFLQVVPLQDNGGALLGVSIIFQDMTGYHRLQDELQLYKQEAETATEELQSTNEELETTNEELQSTNEELETTNEELQSTNEELETMNEELQSTNEELHTINEQLGQRTDEVNHSNAFLESILGSLRSAVIVVDRNLHILTWNSKAEDLWGQHADEAVGQSFFNLDIGLPVAELRGLIRASMAGETDKQEITLTPSTAGAGPSNVASSAPRSSVRSGNARERFCRWSRWRDDR